MLRRITLIAALLALAPSLVSAQFALIAPTPPNGDNGDRIATTAFVQGATGGVVLFNVKNFGAVGNGVTDDTAAITSACAAATNGSTLYFPPSNYKVREIVCLPQGSVAIAATGATLTNTTQTFNTAGGHNTPIFRVLPVNDTFDVSIDGLTIAGPRLTSDTNGGVNAQGSYGGDPLNPGPGYPSGIDIPRARNATVKNSFVTGTYYAGVEIHYAHKTQVAYNTISNHGFSGVTISDSLENDVGYNTIFDVGSVAPNDGYGVNMSTSYNTPTYTHFNGFSSIHHNNISSSKRKGIDVHGGLWGSIHDNIVTGAAYAHIEAICEGADKLVSDWDIHDNHLYGNASFAGGSTAEGAISVGSFSGLEAVVSKTNFRVHGNHMKNIVAPHGISANNNNTVGFESTTISILGNTIAQSTFSDAAIWFNNNTQLFKLVIVASNLIDATVTNAHISIKNTLQAISANNSASGTSGAAVTTITSGVTNFGQFGNVLNGVFDTSGVYQPLDSDLTAIAALTPANDDVIQRKAGAWTNRTMAQLLADLGAIGTTFQPLDSDLTAIAALSTTTFGRSLLTVADAAAGRTALALGTSATQNTGTSGANVPLLSVANTWALAQTFTTAPVFTDQSGSRSALGLGTAAVQNTGTSGANVPLMNGLNTFSAKQTITVADGVVGAMITGATMGVRFTSDASSATVAGTDPTGASSYQPFQIGGLTVGITVSGNNAFLFDANRFGNFVGSMGRNAPVTKTADFTVAFNENWLINNKAGSTCTVTLPSAATSPGREIMIKNAQAQTVVSATANVVPLASGAATTAILASGAGKWATLVSDGTNWVITQSN